MMSFTLQWRTCATQQAHKGGISSLALHGSFLVTGASDSLVKVWLVPEKETGTFAKSIADNVCVLIVFTYRRVPRGANYKHPKGLPHLIGTRGTTWNGM